MLAKLVIMQLFYVALTPPILVAVFLMPVLMYAVLPGFGSPLFPGFMVLFGMLTLQNGDQDVDRGKVIMDHFPLTRQDYLKGLFLFQIAVLLVSGLYAAGFQYVAGQLSGRIFPSMLISKTMALGLALAGLVSALSLGLPPQIGRLVSMVLTMLVTLALVFNKTAGSVFLPGLSLPLCLAIGLAGFLLCFLIAMALLHRAERQAA